MAGHRRSSPRTRLYECSFLAWRDALTPLAQDTAKKHAAGLDIALELEEGRRLIEAALVKPGGDASREDKACAQGRPEAGQGAQVATASGSRCSATPTWWRRCTGRARAPTSRATSCSQVFADREAAAFSAWYELMPRSQSGDPTRHGTFDDVIARLPYVRDLGFDVLYFPPIHPIGRTNRKGRNNTPDGRARTIPAAPTRSARTEGGHDALHPRARHASTISTGWSRRRASTGWRSRSTSPSSARPTIPGSRSIPEWFDWRPDGTIKYAENPPKKYEDIVNVHFYRDAIPGLWYALRDMVLFWVGHGREDLPRRQPAHQAVPVLGMDDRRGAATKHPDAIFLAEAFTRPKVMKRLAKVGFTQSYSYFTWRNTKAELTEYLTELTQDGVPPLHAAELLRQHARHQPGLPADERPARVPHRGWCWRRRSRGNYGIYSGFEICEAAPVPGKEEYLNSEKYEIRAWDLDRPGHIRDDIRLINRLRREHPALQDFTEPRLLQRLERPHPLLRQDDAGPEDDFLLFAVNLDPHNAQGAHFEVPLWEFGLPDEASIEVEDLRARQPLHLARQDPACSARPADSGPMRSGGSIAPGAPR